MKVSLSKNAVYFNTGDWISYDSYGVLDETGFRLESLRPISIPEH
jgi:hypothetical protein